MESDHIRALFLQELEQQTAALSQGVLNLEGHELSGRSIDDVFRAAHSLKGAAQVTGSRAVADVAHGMESVLSALRERTLAVDADVVTMLLQAVDWLTEAAGILAADADPDPRQARALRAALTARADADEPDDGGPPLPVPVEEPGGAVADGAVPLPPARGSDVVRLPAAKLDVLLRQTSEIAVARQRVEAVRRDVALADAAMVRHDAQWGRLRTALASAGKTGALPPDVSAAAKQADATWRAAAAAVGPLAATATGAERDLRQAALPLVDSVLDLRTMPFSQVCEGLDRIARDVARRTEGKQAALVVQGGAVELDRAVALALREPLIHLVHNAVDHGIESAAVRQASGKPAPGQVTLSAELRGDRVEVSVRDDGAGLRTAAIEAAAARAGIAAPEHDDDLIQAIFRPGFSTATQVTETSGRGVGLDAVRARLDGLGGSVTVHSEPGGGTTVTLVAPITLSIMHTISVAVGDQIVMLSSAGVRRVTSVRRDDIRLVAGWPTALVDDRHIRLVDLAETLGWPPADEAADGEVPTIVVDAASVGAPVGLTVSSFLGEGQATVHNVGERVAAAPTVVGVNLLPEGGIALILSAIACARIGVSANPSSVLRPDPTEQGLAAARRILLAEDTLTTRALEQGILEAAGYEVLVAVDGAQAWELLQEHGADLVVSDVDMPRMNGVQLCEAVRASGRFADLPFVLVTSLGDEAARRRGLDAGASAYIVKSGFAQGVLLDTIERLLP